MFSFYSLIRRLHVVNFGLEKNYALKKRCANANHIHTSLLLAQRNVPEELELESDRPKETATCDIVQIHDESFTLRKRKDFTDHPLASLTMFVKEILFVLYLLPLLDCSIFVYNSEDRLSVHDYDCIDHQSTPYCRRLSQPVPLQRNSQSHRCYHNGINHSLRVLRSKNVTVHTILLHWKSTIDQMDEYAHYLRQPIDSIDGDRHVCQCIDSQSFGKNCEYLLPFGTSFSDIVNAKFSITAERLMYAGDIVCYTTLKCDFGLLCLDWRDICDGEQQCMSGLDEENCDKLEFNECEDDEYRCMNGMCIPDEYFLDGEYDCMDMSDEKESFDDSHCPYQSASMACDDRMCPPNRWSCGDGQCIADRILVGSPYNGYVPCFNQRDRFFWCVRVSEENLWTDVNGRCTKLMVSTNSTTSNYCTNLLVCASSELRRLSCPCRGNRCMDLYRNQCITYGRVPHPTSGLLAPYVLQYFNVTARSLLSDTGHCSEAEQSSAAGILPDSTLQSRRRSCKCR